MSRPSKSRGLSTRPDRANKNPVELPDIFKGLSPEQANSLSAFFAVSRSGPLPTPADLEHYARVIPDGADRIMSMAEREQAMRSRAQDMAEVSMKDKIEGNKSRRRLADRGLFVSAILMLAFIGAGIYCASLSLQWAAATAFGIGVAHSVSLFVSRKKPVIKNSHKQNDEK